MAQLIKLIFLFGGSKRRPTLIELYEKGCLQPANTDQP